jgi:hypothetical protein
VTKPAIPKASHTPSRCAQAYKTVEPTICYIKLEKYKPANAQPNEVELGGAKFILFFFFPPAKIERNPTHIAHIAKTPQAYAVSKALAKSANFANTTVEF